MRNYQLGLIHEEFVAHVRSAVDLIAAEDRDGLIRGLRGMLKSIPARRRSVDSIARVST